MTSLSSMFTYPLLLALFLALSQESQGQLVPADLLNFIPAVCLPDLNNVVLPCALNNLCFALFPTPEEIAAIPAQADIQSCVDVEAGLCPITSRCAECKDVVDDLFKCVIINTGTIFANTTELINSCSLDCTLVPTSAPVVPPTEAPVEVVPSSTPVASESSYPVAEFEDEGNESEESGAMKMMASSVAAISAIISLVLGW